MKGRKGISAIGMLLTLLIVALLFLYFTGNLFKNENQNTNTKNSLNVQEEEINQKLNELQTQRNEMQNNQQKQIDDLRKQF